jgi:hypothetical protein
LRALLNMGFYMGLNGYVFGIGKVSYKAWSDSLPYQNNIIKLSQIN